MQSLLVVGNTWHLSDTFVSVDALSVKVLVEYKLFRRSWDVYCTNLSSTT
jgi:hypothetical protein